MTTASLLALAAVFLLAPGVGWRRWIPPRERAPFISWFPTMGSKWWFVAATMLLSAATVILFEDGRIGRGFELLIGTIGLAGVSVYRSRGGR